MRFMCSCRLLFASCHRQTVCKILRQVARHTECLLLLLLLLLFVLCACLTIRSLGSLSKGRHFERRTSNGSEVSFILKRLEATKFVFLSVFTIKETICQNNWAKPPSKNEKMSPPVDLRRSKTSLLKLAIIASIILNLF